MLVVALVVVESVVMVVVAPTAALVAELALVVVLPLPLPRKRFELVAEAPQRHKRPTTTIGEHTRESHLHQPLESHRATL